MKLVIMVTIALCGLARLERPAMVWVSGPSCWQEQVEEETAQDAVRRAGWGELWQRTK